MIRTDIQLWRFIAVSAVVLFHIDPTLVPGGYLGVDLFFAISGFLMTGQILRKREDDSWSMRSFLWRRVKRLFPALYVTIGLTLIGAMLFFTPDRVISTAQSSLAAAFAGSNFLFWQTTDYFDTSTAIDPLLHTWSLGVEEQFYLAWPFILGGVLALSRSFAIRALAILLLFAVSLTAAEWMVHSNANTAFFLLPFRVFEFCVGGIAALYVHRFGLIRLGWPAFIAAMATSGTCLFLLDEAAPIPGLYALAPLIPLGVSLIFNTPFKGAVAWITAPFKAIGDFSYSLYLVHWPVVIFWPYLASPDLSPVASIFGQTIVSLVLGYSLYAWVETPLRSPSIQRGNLVTGSVVTALGLAIAACSTLTLTQPVNPEDWQAKLIASMEKKPEQYDLGKCFLEEFKPLSVYQENGCISETSDRPHIVLFGDSLAGQYSKALRKVAEDEGWRFSQITKGACSPVLNMGDDACNAHNVAMLEYFETRSDIDLFVVAGSWFNHRNTRVWLGRTLENLETNGAAIVLLGPAPRFDESVPRLIMQYSSEPGKVDEKIFTHYVPDMREHDAIFRSELTSMQPGYFTLDQTQLVSIVDLMCVKECRILVGPDEPAFRDVVHLTPSGAQWVVDQIQGRVESAIEP